MSEPAYSLTLPESDDGRVWPPQGGWTWEDYLRLPEDGRRYEVVRGHLYVTPAPAYDHQFCVWQLGRLVGNHVVENGLGVILLAPFDIRLPGGIGNPVQPDVAFVRAERRPEPGAPYFEGAPDLVVEVLSPGTRRRDRTVKLAAYREAGVPEVWLVDPRTRSAQVFTREEGGDLRESGRYGPGDLLTSASLPGLRLPVADLFAR